MRIYTKPEIRACVHLDYNYEVRLPKSYKELYQWGDYMHTCLREYDDSIKTGLTIIYGFFNGEVLQFVVRIYDISIAEAKVRENHPITQTESMILDKWFNEYFR